MRKYILTILLVAGTIFSAQKGYGIEPYQGSVIILDGTSTAGKTSIAKNLMNMLDDSYEYIALDDFVSEVFLEQERQHFSHKELLRRHFQRTGDMYDKTIKRVKKGKNVIVDTVFSGHEGEKDIRQGLEKLKDLKVFMALAYCPLPVLADRINSRSQIPTTKVEGL